MKKTMELRLKKASKRVLRKARKEACELAGGRVAITQTEFWADHPGHAHLFIRVGTQPEGIRFDISPVRLIDGCNKTVVHN